MDEIYMYVVYIIFVAAALKKNSKLFLKFIANQVGV